MNTPSTLTPARRGRFALATASSTDLAPASGTASFEPEAPSRARRVATLASSPLRNPLGLPLALFGITLVLIVAHQGRLVEIFFPLGAFLVALRFYRRSPAHYLGFICWLFFLTPEVRRLVDFTGGTFNPQSPIMIAPLVAVALSGFSVAVNFGALGQRRSAPLMLIFVALFYSFVIGMVRVGPAAASFTLITWLFPVLVAFRLLVTWRDYPAYHRVLLKTFVYGSLVMGVYGVIEYISPSPWDAFWLLSAKMASEGHPLPFQMRVSSTMNSAGPFSVTIMTLLLMSLAGRGKTRTAAGLAAIPALLFTGVRSAWGGWAIGLLYPLAMLDGKSRVRLIGAVLGFALMAAPLLMIDQVSEPIMQRFGSVQNLSQDDSYQVRMQFYKQFMTSALTDIAGQGLGTIGLGAKLSDDDSVQMMVEFDSGLMEVPYVMGWPGTLLYTMGVVMLLWRAYRASRLRSTDRLAICSVGVAIAIISMMLFVNTLVGVSGMFFFIGVSLPVIALRYAREGHDTASATPSSQVKGSR